MPTPILEIIDLHKSFPGPRGRVEVLRGIRLTLDAGNFHALKGPSGSGKSTLLSVAGGLLTPDQGRVSIAGEGLYAKGGRDRAALRARQIGFVFQRFHLLPYLTIEENVMTSTLALPGKLRAGAAEALLDSLGLSQRLRHFPDQLSVGERQRVAVARAIAHKPRLLLADEPTGNLDPANADLILDAFARFADEGGAVLLVTHEERAAARAHQQLALHNGQLVQP